MAWRRAGRIIAAGLLLLAACGGDGEDGGTGAPTTATGASTTGVPTTDGTAPATTGGEEPVPTTALPAAPWAGPRLPADEVPPVLLAEWRAGGARADCAALAPVDLGQASGGTARAADFGAGAWAVAWDVPGAPGRDPSGAPCAGCGRGTVLVAGTGLDVAEAVPPAGSVLPNTRRWADGSVARYGLTGGTGPGYLAHLEVAGQRCLYNVGSFLGQGHLEQLLENLRFVEGAP